MGRGLKEKRMKYREEMKVVWKRGYCMGFEESKGEVRVRVG